MHALRLTSPSCSRCARPRLPQVLLYLSRAYYDSDDLQQAKKVLLQAIHRDPTNYRMRFNVALTMQVGAKAVCAPDSAGHASATYAVQANASHCSTPLIAPSYVGLVAKQPSPAARA